ncbi:hypothetical protein D5b_00410 [Faustovirus]|nr:hypothetical protein D5b_00410 [Faustovirus]AMN84506.1 hypothetical protein D6_00095 [Faustovirus]AMP44352.1 hypothetical protein PRJ_Dakar_00401 [Faustovirus]
MSFVRKNVTLRIDDIEATALCYDNVDLPSAGYRLVGRSTADIFTNKILIDPSNTIASNNILVGSSVITVGGSAPTAGQVLTATSTSAVAFASPFPVTGSITAFAGGGQESATQLANTVNVVTTVATAADSVKLPLAANWAGRVIVVKNTSANSMDLFPGTDDSINALLANAAYAVAATTTAILVPVSATNWQVISIS